MNRMHTQMNNLKIIDNNTTKYKLVDLLFKVPFSQFPQYKDGLIDEKGNLKIRRSQMSASQRAKITVYDAAIISTKKVLQKLPANISLSWKFEFAKSLIELQKNLFEGEAAERVNEFLSEDVAPLMSVGANVVAGIPAGNASISPGDDTIVPPSTKKPSPKRMLKRRSLEQQNPFSRVNPS